MLSVVIIAICLTVLYGVSSWRTPCSKWFPDLFLQHLWQNYQVFCRHMRLLTLHPNLFFGPDPAETAYHAPRTPQSVGEGDTLLPSHSPRRLELGTLGASSICALPLINLLDLQINHCATVVQRSKTFWHRRFGAGTFQRSNISAPVLTAPRLQTLRHWKLP